MWYGIVIYLLAARLVYLYSNSNNALSAMEWPVLAWKKDGDKIKTGLRKVIRKVRKKDSPVGEFNIGVESVRHNGCCAEEDD
jgi:hypothetical protein